MPVVSPSNEAPLVETRIEDGKLLYERRWFHRGQSVYIEGRDMPKFPASISAIGTEAVRTTNFILDLFLSSVLLVFSYGLKSLMAAKFEYM